MVPMGFTGCLVAIVALVVAIKVHWVLGLILFVFGAVISSVKSAKDDEERLAALTARFGADIAGRIMREEIWEGATREMIQESLGDPVDTDEKVMKGKTRHTLKYDRTGRNKFGLRVTLENDVCVGWDDKR